MVNDRRMFLDDKNLIFFVEMIVKIASKSSKSKNQNIIFLSNFFLSEFFLESRNKLLEPIRNLIVKAMIVDRSITRKDDTENPRNRYYRNQGSILNDSTRYSHRDDDKREFTHLTECSSCEESVFFRMPYKFHQPHDEIWLNQHNYKQKADNHSSVDRLRKRNMRSQ